ncbi:hypothetical protein BpHYR1_053374 [Brachionus plicatilis]|uniref:Uncharacterized protein n=1 Tax=Brachionus plicatilis TaxID=10195 RepID=A0A3M7S793_BRAPC|nr:hypothetical protein BpHYR1_053374 [Brachionus plicatilis]
MIIIVQILHILNRYLVELIKIDYDFCTTLSSFRECNMVQHSKLHLLSKSANDVQNLCKMHYARTY